MAPRLYVIVGNSLEEYQIKNSEYDDVYLPIIKSDRKFDNFEFAKIALLKMYDDAKVKLDQSIKALEPLTEKQFLELKT